MKKHANDLWDFDRIVTEDDVPVASLFAEKQQRLLVSSLNTSWKPGFPFLAASYVGLFYDPAEPPVVPDVLVSLDVKTHEDMWEKRHRSYFVSEFGKPPDIAVEIVPNSKGGETGKKFREYADAGVTYYIIFDPLRVIQKDALRV